MDILLPGTAGMSQSPRLLTKERQCRTLLCYWPGVLWGPVELELALRRECVSVNIYVGNLSYEVTDEDLREAFAAFGQVESARIVMDKSTGMSRGFGFVEMPTQAEAEAAISGLTGTDLKGRAISANEARPRPQGGRGGGGGGGGPRRGPGGGGAGPRRGPGGGRDQGPSRGERRW